MPLTRPACQQEGEFKQGDLQVADTGEAGARRLSPWRVAGWGFAGLLLLLPLVAMQFTGEVKWDATDFIVAGLLIGSVGVAFEVTVRMTTNFTYRAASAVALGVSFMTIWANGAVGMIGNEDNRYNLLFLAVIGLALLGAVIARFRSAGMAAAMLIAGVAHAGIALGGIGTDMRGAMFSTVFALGWLMSAALFRHAAGRTV